MPKRFNNTIPKLNELEIKKKQAISFIENEHSFNHIHISTLLSLIVLSLSLSLFPAFDFVVLLVLLFCSCVSLFYQIKDLDYVVQTKPTNTSTSKGLSPLEKEDVYSFTTILLVWVFIFPLLCMSLSFYDTR